MSDDDKQTIFGFPVASIVFVDKEREAELARLRAACQKNDNDIEQILGKALGYPKYCDDQTNFPGSTDADGVCVGDHVAASLAMQAADLITRLRAELAAMTARKDGWRLIALAALRECYSEWVGGEIRDTDDYWKMFDMMNAELRDRMDDIRAGVPMWRVRHD